MDDDDVFHLSIIDIRRLIQQQQIKGKHQGAKAV